MLGKIEFEGQSVNFVDPNKQNLIAEVSTKVSDFFYFIFYSFVFIPFRSSFLVISKSLFRQRSSFRSTRVEEKKGSHNS